MKCLLWVSLRSCVLFALSVSVLDALPSASPVHRGEADAVYRGTTTLLESGDTATKFDIVFLGDGFTDDELGLYASKVNQAVNAFLGTHPFSALHSAINIHRVDIASTESGVDVPATCGMDPIPASPQDKKTALDTTYCGFGDHFRLVSSSNLPLIQKFALMAPGLDVVLVLVNHQAWGGAKITFNGMSIAFSSISDDFELTVIHELGHAIGSLADEYCDDDETPDGPPYSGPASAMNVTARLSPLKWADLVLPSTPIPTRLHGDALVDPLDLVGAYEGGKMTECRGIFRPQPNCRMKDAWQPFCSVCRRKLIQDLQRSLVGDLSLRLTDLLIRDKNEPWWRGVGDIYFLHELTSSTVTLGGRWPPGGGDVGFESGQSRTLGGYGAGVVPTPRPGEVAVFRVRVREADGPDEDDVLQNDDFALFTGPGAIQVDQPHYRLDGTVEPANLFVLLDMLMIKEDADFATAGDIYVVYSVSNGTETVQGRWPAGGTRGIESGVAVEMGVLAAALPRPAEDGVLSLSVRVMEDDDDWLFFPDEVLGVDVFSLDSSTGFGTSQTTHIEDRPRYRLTYSVASP